MAAKLIQPTDAIEVKQICALIYGQPGSRKSSLAQTAEEPITLAFDPGIYRAYGRKAAVLFDTWTDVLEFDTRPYKTINVDTIGMALDKLSAAIIQDNPKNGNRLGGLSLPGYGVLKTQFANWVTSCKSRGQDLVFVAHEKADKHGDDVYYCPDIVGGSYNTMMNHADAVGYMHFDKGKKVIDFAPTDLWMAKTPPCGWGQITLPDFKAEPHFLAQLLAQAKASMGKISEASAASAAVVGAWQEWIATDPNLDAFNARLPEVGKLDNGVKTQVWHIVKAHADKCGLAFDPKAKTFALKQEAAA